MLSLGERRSFSINLPTGASKMTAAMHNTIPRIFTSQETSSIFSSYYGEKGEFKRGVLSNTPQQLIENGLSIGEGSPILEYPQMVSWSG